MAGQALKPIKALVDCPRTHHHCTPGRAWGAANAITQKVQNAVGVGVRETTFHRRRVIPETAVFSAEFGRGCHAVGAQPSKAQGPPFALLLLPLPDLKALPVPGSSLKEKREIRL